MIDIEEKSEILNYPSKKTLRLHFTQNNVTNLGPGVRCGIWVQGCNKRCKGCVAPEAWSKEGGYDKNCEILLNEIVANKEIKGITISGGEPLLQWKELSYIIQNVQKARSDITVLLYTGYSWEDDIKPILDNKSQFFYASTIRAFSAFLNCLDWWVDGDYQADQDDGRGLRGSSNQSLYGNILVNEQKALYRQEKKGHWIDVETKRPVTYPTDDDPMSDFSIAERDPKIIKENDATYLIGIPSKAVLETFNGMIKGEKNKQNTPGAANTIFNQPTAEPEEMAVAEKNTAEFDLLQNKYQDLEEQFQNIQKQLADVQDEIEQYKKAFAKMRSEKEELSNYRKKNVGNLTILIDFCVSLKKRAEVQSTRIEKELAKPDIQTARKKELGALSTDWEAIKLSIDSFIEQWGFTSIEPKNGDAFNHAEHYVENKSSSTKDVIKELLSPGYKADGIVIKQAVVRLLPKRENVAARGAGL